MHRGLPCQQLAAKLFNRFSQNRMHLLRRYLGKRSKHEIPLLHQRMRQLEPGRIHHRIIVKNDVDVYQPRRIGFARTRLFGGFRLTVAPEAPLYLLQRSEQLLRGEVGIDLHRLILEIVCGGESPRLAFVDVRTAQHDAYAGIYHLLCLSQARLHISHVTARYDYSPCHLRITAYP